MKKKLVILVALISNSLLLFAQYDTSFWFAAPTIVPYYTTVLNKPIILRLEAKNNDALVEISQPANINFSTISVFVPKNSFYSVDLSNFIDNIECKPANKVLNFGLLIQSSTPIFAFYDIVSSPGDPETYSLKGHYALGNYFVIPGQNLYSNHPDYSPTPYDRFYVAASEDSTTVTINPSNDITGHNSKLKFDVVLNKGQVYVAEATSQDANFHLRGSIITSDKPVAITICDDLIAYDYCQNQSGDQILPVANFGTEYALVKGDLVGGDFLEIIASQDNTQINIDDNTATINLNQFEFYKIDVTGDLMYLKSDKPILVMQYTGVSCEVGVSTLIPISCGGGINNFNYTFVPTPYPYYDGVFLITVAKGHENDFLLDNNPLNISFSPFKGKPNLLGGKAYINTQPYNQPFCLRNTTSNFNLGFIEGKNAGGAFSYFSDFSSDSVTDVNLSGLVDIDFSKVPLNISRTESMVIQNKSINDITITSVKVKNNPNIFKITTTPALPAKISANGNISISIDFKSTELNDYSDILIIETDNPCFNAIYTTIKGTTDLGTFVYLPDTTAYIGQDNFCIPLMLSSGKDTFNIPNLSYTAKISFDATVMDITTPEEGVILSGKRYINMHGDNINLTNASAKLGEMCGLVLLSDIYTAPLIIEEFTWSESKIQVNKLDGKLTTIGVCQRPIRGIKSFQPTQLEIFPNPANEELKIIAKSEEEGSLTLKLFTIQGIELYSEFWLNNCKTEKTIRINLDGYPAGIYYIILKSKYNTEIEKVSIFK